MCSDWRSLQFNHCKITTQSSTSFINAYENVGERCSLSHFEEETTQTGANKERTKQSSAHLNLMQTFKPSMPYILLFESQLCQASEETELLHSPLTHETSAWPDDHSIRHIFLCTSPDAYAISTQPIHLSTSPFFSVSLSLIHLSSSVNSKKKKKREQEQGSGFG